MAPSVCHPDKSNFVGGQCRSCYSRKMRLRTAPCHPKRKLFARGMCRPCWEVAKSTPIEKVSVVPLCHPNRSHDSNGLCASCAAIARTRGLNPERFLALKSVTHCPVCGFEGELVIDHDHSTGEVRGPLCRYCNLALGHALEDPDRLQKLADYARSFERRGIA